MLRSIIEQVLVGLDQIDGLASFVDHDFFARADLRVTLLAPYLLGDQDRTVSLLDATAEEARLKHGADDKRGNPEHWLDLLRLDELRGHYGVPSK